MVSFLLVASLGRCSSLLWGGPHSRRMVSSLNLNEKIARLANIAQQTHKELKQEQMKDPKKFNAQFHTKSLHPGDKLIPIMPNKKK